MYTRGFVPTIVLTAFPKGPLDLSSLLGEDAASLPISPIDDQTLIIDCDYDTCLRPNERSALPIREFTPPRKTVLLRGKPAAIAFPGFCFAPILLLCLGLGVLGQTACRKKTEANVAATASPTATPTPKPEPYIAFLRDGNLWLVRSDGSGERALAIAPEGTTIQDFVWSLDGTRLYYSINTYIFEVVVESANAASAGELTAPPGVVIDRLELGKDGKTLIVHALDADAASRLYAVTIGQREARELSIDQYAGLLPVRSRIINNQGEMSVSPDGRWLLFKSSVGAGEELFIASLETGARKQITNLYQLGGFEESVDTEGGRRVLEASWSPDGRYVLFNPMQSCSELGLCYGRLYLVDWNGGPQLQLSIEMMLSLPQEWNATGTLLTYDDGSNVVLTDTMGSPRALAEGNRPKWQPQP